MQNLNTANQNVVPQAASVNHAVSCGHSADCVVTTAKHLLGRKRLSVPSYKPASLESGSTPGSGAQRRLATSGARPDVRTFPDFGNSPTMPGDMPAPAWAALVITRALCG
jgi:hypothetical protein